MPSLLVISHPEVVIDPDTLVTDWSLSDLGRQRAAAFASKAIFADVTEIWASSERKARETAGILATPRNLSVKIDPCLGENDRSATGYLPRNEFEAGANAFFREPQNSFCGWETAIKAQNRILETVTGIVASHRHKDLAIVTHGAVGTLLWCALSDRPIDRMHDQPSQGHYWRAELPALDVRTGWRAID